MKDVPLRTDTTDAEKVYLYNIDNESCDRRKDYGGKIECQNIYEYYCHAENWRESYTFNK